VSKYDYFITHIEVSFILLKPKQITKKFSEKHYTLNASVDISYNKKDAVQTNTESVRCISTANSKVRI